MKQKLMTEFGFQPEEPVPTYPHQAAVEFDKKPTYEELEAELAKTKEDYRIAMLCVKDACEDEDRIKELCRTQLTEWEVYGDSYVVPSAASVVELFIVRMVELMQDIKDLNDCERCTAEAIREKQITEAIRDKQPKLTL